MSLAVEILGELQRRGVTIRVEGDALKLRPAQALVSQILEKVKAHKPDILAALRNRPATCAASCYQVDPARWIHHPWDGCKTVSARKVWLQ